MSAAAVNLQVRLAQRPAGMPRDECWDVSSTPVPQPGAGEILVRNDYISLDPAMRGWIRDVRSYIPPVQIGEVMRAGTAGEVVASGNPKFAVGTKVSGWLGVQQFAVSDGQDLVSVDDSVAPLPLFLATLGMPGMTAYFGLLDVGQPQPGDTVVVSAAAGAVGQVAGQIAKIKGCRVVGLAGSAEKCRYVVDELGFDACIDYKSESVADSLKQHCPKGVNLYFDNVGGEILDQVLRRLAPKARVVICGAVSQYNNEGPTVGPSNYLTLLVSRARMEGFVVMDYASRYREAATDMAGWIASGQLLSKLDIVAGLESFPATLRKLFTGENFGKLLIKV